MLKHYDITIYGRVQDVFFRENAKQVADILGVFGFIQNQDDGTVYMEAEGDEKTLEAMVHWCKDGSPAAKVSKVEAKQGQIKNLKGFSIIR